MALSIGRGRQMSIAIKKRYWRVKNRIKKRTKVWDYYRINALEREALFLFPELRKIRMAPAARTKVTTRTKKPVLKVEIRLPRFRVPQIHLPKVQISQFKIRPPRPDFTGLKKQWVKWIKHSKKWKQKAARSFAQNFKNLTRHAVRTSAFSLLIFSVGFITINFNAYSDIAMTWFTQDIRGIEPEKTMEEVFVEEPEEEPKQELLTIYRTPEEQKSAIPELNLDVKPPDNRLIIPKINKNIPIMITDPQKLVGADWQSLEKTFQEDLQNGVVQYPGTANPGEIGNTFITGHSSYYLWDPGRYKDVFARLNQVVVGDDIVVYFNQQKYNYKVREVKQVKNSDVSVLAQGDEKLLTLMTCSPVGTNFRRLVVIAELVE